MGLGVAIGAGWGYVIPLVADGDSVIGMTMGAGAGLVIALLAGAATYRVAASERE